MGRAERRIEAGYQKVVLAGYVVAVEVAEAWRWLTADRRIILKEDRKEKAPKGSSPPGPLSSER
jgi:hypothetical protein